ncbi:MAG: hypothetical protein J0H96_12005 [Microbacterium ginsengisoli]|jgi:hypothetical protein|nr:hypothetical protein [Microbacterium ginsengisoli]
MSTPEPAAPAPEPASPVPPAPKATNGLGLAALIVAIVAFLFAVVPVLSFIAWLPALVAIGLAIPALIIKGRKRGTAIAGLIVAIVAWIVAIIVSVVSALGVANVIASYSPTPIATATTPTGDSTAAAGGKTVRYEVTSDATITNVSYLTITANGSGQESATDAPAPFVKEITIPSSDTAFDYKGFTLVAQAGAGATTISCKITFDGQVIAEQTSTGQYSVVTCNGNG